MVNIRGCGCVPHAAAIPFELTCWDSDNRGQKDTQVFEPSFVLTCNLLFFQIALTLSVSPPYHPSIFYLPLRTMGLPWRHSVVWAFVAAWCIGAHAGYQSEVDQSKIRKIPVSYQRRNRKKLLLTGTFSKQLRSHSLSVVSSFRRT